MKKLFFTSDWHIGHANVLKFDKRPFRDLDHMHEVLVRRFNYYVPHHGLTYFLGDMGLCSGTVLKDVISQLNGTKVLVRGNHDGKANAMYNAGFDVVVDKAQIMVGKTIVTMSHCPLQGIWREDTSQMRGHVPGDNWHGETRHKHKFSFPDFGQYHLHGHLHSKRDKAVVDGQLDVGVVAHNYAPVRLSQVESWIATGRFKFGH